VCKTFQGAVIKGPSFYTVEKIDARLSTGLSYVEVESGQANFAAI